MHKVFILKKKKNGMGGKFTNVYVVVFLNSLPIIAQPDYIKKALLAGKHVLSEKPVAKDLETGLYACSNVYGKRFLESTTLKNDVFFIIQPETSFDGKKPMLRA